MSHGRVVPSLPSLPSYPSLSSPLVWTYFPKEEKQWESSFSLSPPSPPVIAPTLLRSLGISYLLYSRLYEVDLRRTTRPAAVIGAAPSSMQNPHLILELEKQKVTASKRSTNLKKDLEVRRPERCMDKSGRDKRVVLGIVSFLGACGRAAGG